MAIAEFELYSFEPMRNNSSSEDEASEGEEPRRGNTTWYSCDLWTNWEGQQEVLENAIVGFSQVRGMRAPQEMNNMYVNKLLKERCLTQIFKI